MCQTAGIRCYPDTLRRLETLNARRDKLSRELEKVSTDITRTGGLYSARLESLLRKQADLQKRVNTTLRDLRVAQKDLDGTKTGRKALEQQLAEARTSAEISALQLRIKSADALREARKRHRALYESKEKPLLFIPELQSA